jgi:hypothetical protein
MFSIFSLPKSASSLWLGISEGLLLAFGALLVIGLIGEYSKSDRWKPFVRAFERMVIIGVAGELLADGGIFLLSRRLQTLSDREVAQFTQQAALATETAKGFESQIAVANEHASKAELETARLNKMAEDERNTRLFIETRIAPRSFNTAQVETLKSALAKYPGQSFDLFGFFWGTKESMDFTRILAAVLNQSGWHANIFWLADSNVPFSDVHIEKLSVFFGRTAQ